MGRKEHIYSFFYERLISKDYRVPSDYNQAVKYFRYLATKPSARVSFASQKNALVEDSNSDGTTREMASEYIQENFVRIPNGSIVHKVSKTVNFDSNRKTEEVYQVVNNPTDLVTTKSVNVWQASANIDPKTGERNLTSEPICYDLVSGKVKYVVNFGAYHDAVKTTNDGIIVENMLNAINAVNKILSSPYGSDEQEDSAEISK